MTTAVLPGATALRTVLKDRVYRYTAMVSLAGLGGMALAARTIPDVEFPSTPAFRWTVLLLMLLVMAGEVWTIRVPHGDDEEEDLTTSTAFAFALLCTVGAG